MSLPFHSVLAPSHVNSVTALLRLVIASWSTSGRQRPHFYHYNFFVSQLLESCLYFCLYVFILLGSGCYSVFWRTVFTFISSSEATGFFIVISFSQALVMALAWWPKVNHRVFRLQVKRLCLVCRGATVCLPAVVSRELHLFTSPSRKGWLWSSRVRVPRGVVLRLHITGKRCSFSLLRECSTCYRRPEVTGVLSPFLYGGQLLA